MEYPPTSGKRLRTLNLIVRLAKRHQLTYVGRCQNYAADAPVAAEYLRDAFAQHAVIDVVHL